MSSSDFQIRLLVVDDEQSIRKLCMTVGESLGLVCLEAESGEAALALLEEQPTHMVLTDMIMPQMSGLEFLEQVKRLVPRTEVAVMTGHGSIETAVQAMRLGAYDYITKPFKLDEVDLIIKNGLERKRLRDENLYLRKQLETQHRFENIIGKSAKIVEVFDTIRKIADSPATAMISGESGTGKELVARVG
jgi:DNA-binding NtrC family response regulator